MKASLKFREDRRPLLRAKVPISVVGLPFLSGVSAGDPSDLRLDLSTAFDSGPALRLSYRPNLPSAPFSLAVKTGVGALGSPASAPFTMTAEFSLLGRGAPAFTVHFKPRLGDFCVSKTAGATAPELRLLGGSADRDSDGEGFSEESPGMASTGYGAMFAEKKPNGVATEGIRSTSGRGFSGMLSGLELTARSILPLPGGTAVKFRWGVKIPPEARSTNIADDFSSRYPLGGITALSKIPLLVMSKVSVERLSEEPKPIQNTAGDSADAADPCLLVQRQLAALHSENTALLRAVENLRSDVPPRRSETTYPGAITAKGSRPEVKSWEGGRNGTRAGEPAKNGTGGGKKGNGKTEEKGGRATKEDVNEELKKALTGATGGGAAARPLSPDLAGPAARAFSQVS